MRQAGNSQQQCRQSKANDKGGAISSLIGTTIVVWRFRTNGAVAHGILPKVNLLELTWPNAYSD
jgi:hypothetical protein